MKSNELSPKSSKNEDRLQRIRMAANLAVLVMVGVMIAAGMASYRQLDSQIQSRRWVLHTYEVLNALQSQRAQILTADLAVQQYLLTSNSSFKTAYEKAKVESTRLQQVLSRSTADNPKQQDALLRLEPRLSEHFGSLQRAVHTNNQTEKELLASDHLPQITAILDEMQASEAALLNIRSNALNEISHTTFLLIAAVCTMAVLFQLMLAAFIAYWVRAQRRTEARLTATLKSMEEGLYQIDKQGNLVYMNPKAEALLGFQLSDVAGDHMHDLIHNKNEDGTLRPASECSLLSVIQTGMPLRVPSDVFVRKDGSLLPVELSSSPLVEDSETTGAVICFNDITNRRAIEKRMNEFYSIVSHELRTPLTSIRAALGLLESGAAGALTPRGTQLAQIGRQESERLVRLINDILDMKKIETGKLELNLTTLDVADIIESTAEVMASAAHNEGVHIATDTVAGLFIHADKDRTIQVLTNLISNAIKFSGRGTTVTVGALDVDGMVRLTVKDQGPGIPSNKIGLLFGMFQQLDSTDARAKGGTGLGLAISKSIAEAHGGTIGVDSTEGNGSTFWFQMPIAAVPVSQPEIAAVENGQASVLVVDDDDSTRELIRQQLEGLSLNCILAGTGTEAIELAIKYGPDLIVLDLLLPEKSGFDVVEALRKQEALKDTPMIVYTASDVSDAQKQHLTLGPTVVLIKTKTTEHELLEAIRNSLPRSKKSG